MQRSVRVGFLMDPLESIVVGHDSTFALMLEAQRRGHEVRYLLQEDLGIAELEVVSRQRTVRLQPKVGAHFDVVTDRVAPLEELDVLFLRKDPPVDVAFVHATRLVELARLPLCINEPRALRDVHEKLFALRFPDLIPSTFISRDVAQLREFVRRWHHGAVLKPVDGFGGRGVVMVKPDRSLKPLLELVTRGGAAPVIAQPFLPESRVGDKRIMLLDGEPIGALHRVPRRDDFRANMAAGAAVERTELTERDREICARLAPELRSRGIILAGVDVIGGYLIEVNVTSPTGLVEIDALEKTSLEGRVFDWLEARLGLGPQPELGA